MIITAIIAVSCLVFQWRTHSYGKWKKIHDQDKMALLVDPLFNRVGKLSEELTEYKKRVDSLTLKAGFKL